MKETELVEELTRFGLDERSARVYYHLSRLGQATASEVAQATDVQRTEVYRVMEDLEDHGFVEKTLERPRKYVPRPVKTALDAKLKDARREVETLEETSQELADLWPSVQHDEDAIRERFSVHQGRHQIRGVLERMIDHAEEELLLVALRRGIPRLDTMGVLDDLVDRASDVRVRVLTEVDEDPHEGVARLAEDGELRHLDLPGYAQLLIADASEIALFVSLDPLVSTQGTGETVLWLNARDFILAQKALFDTLWATGIDHAARRHEVEAGQPAARAEIVRGRWMRYERTKEMLHRAEASARIMVPPEDADRFARAGIDRALERAIGRGVDVEVVAPADPGLERVEVDEREAAPGLAMLVVDQAEALIGMGIRQDPESMASEDEWSVWATHDDMIDHVAALIDDPPLATPRTGRS